MEEIIYRYLQSQFKVDDDGITLAQYNNLPAVFNMNAPDDKDENWNDGKSQYPRIIFDLNMQADSERKISGQLFVDVMCENNSNSVQPEELETIVHSTVDGCFFSTSELSISAQWNTSNPFNEKDNKLSGITLIFDVLAYPVQETSSPDPVLSVNLWLKTLNQSAYVIGRDVLPDVWKPTDDSPALYCRLTNLGDSNRMKSTAAVTWIGADMHINVMAPSEQVRSTIVKNSVQILKNATRLMLDDGSPMLIDNVTSNVAADPLREGQIHIKTTYGVLNEYTGTPIKHAYIGGMNAEREVKNDG